MESGIEEEGWEIVDDYPSLEHEQGGQKSRLGWVMDAGKKVVITGLVVSSIPLFLPPLVVISALGLAFSVPYGVVFASYACTQKLMTKLLLPPSPEAEDNQIMREGYHNLEVEEQVEEKEPYFDGIIKDDMNEGENLLPEKIITETETVEKNGEETEHLPQDKNEKIITETETGVKNEEETEHLPQDKNEKIITEANKDEGEENGAVDKESVLEKNETKKDDGEKMKKETGKRRKKKKDWGKRKEAEGKGEGVNLESGKVIVVEEGSTNDVPAENFEVTTVVIQDDSSVTVFETTAIIADGKGKELKEDKEDNAEVKVIEVKQGKDIAGLHSEDQEAFRDEKIWEKIDAIRGIMGFKAPRRDSYYEELKALYLFTGIEAPATSSDTPAADFVEFYSKLCFLMSVIGVK